MRAVTLTRFTATFVPFGLLVSAALLAADTAPDASRARLDYSIWASLALAIPAFALYVWPGRSGPKAAYWRLLWTFAFLAYLVHFYYAVAVHYHGSLRAVYQGQGVTIASSNFLVTGWWALDVALAWLVDDDPGQRRWVRVQRGLVVTGVFVVFTAASVFLFHGFVNVLGYALVAVVAGGLAVRLGRRAAAGSTTAMTPGVGGTP